MAGMGMRDIKRKIKSTTNTMQITNAMQLVSTAKLRKSKEKMDITRPYFETVIETVQNIIANEKRLKHVYIQNDGNERSLYIVVTADRGLCGGYNININKKTLNDFDQSIENKLITIGSKSKHFFGKEDVDIIHSYTGISEKPTYSSAKSIAKKALDLYIKDEIDTINLVYTRFITTINQEPTILRLLPIDSAEKTDTVDEDQEFITYEPSPEMVLDYIVPKYIESTIYGAMVESAAAEQAARRVAMESATDNAKEMIDDLTLSFNQARQAAITQEISEIVGGAEALKNN